MSPVLNRRDIDSDLRVAMESSAAEAEREQHERRAALTYIYRRVNDPTSGFSPADFHVLVEHMGYDDLVLQTGQRPA